MCLGYVLASITSGSGFSITPTNFHHFGRRGGWVGWRAGGRAHLALGEVVGDVLHGVSAQARAVVVLVLGAPQREDALLDVLAHLTDGAC